MLTELDIKVLKLAAQICNIHASDKPCQEWTGSTYILDSLTPEDRDWLMKNYNGDNFEPGHFPYDEMVISYIVAEALRVLARRVELSRKVEQAAAREIGS